MPGSEIPKMIINESADIVSSDSAFQTPEPATHRCCLQLRAVPVVLAGRLKPVSQLQ